MNKDPLETTNRNKYQKGATKIKVSKKILYVRLFSP